MLTLRRKYMKILKKINLRYHIVAVVYAITLKSKAIVFSIPTTFDYASQLRRF